MAQAFYKASMAQAFMAQTASFSSFTPRESPAPGLEIFNLRAFEINDNNDDIDYHNIPLTQFKDLSLWLELPEGYQPSQQLFPTSAPPRRSKTHRSLTPPNVDPTVHKLFGGIRTQLDKIKTEQGRPRLKQLFPTSATPRRSKKHRSLPPPNVDPTVHKLCRGIRTQLDKIKTEQALRTEKEGLNLKGKGARVWHKKGEVPVSKGKEHAFGIKKGKSQSQGKRRDRQEKGPVAKGEGIRVWREKPSSSIVS